MAASGSIWGFCFGKTTPTNGIARAILLWCYWDQYMFSLTGQNQMANFLLALLLIVIYVPGGHIAICSQLHLELMGRRYKSEEPHRTARNIF